MASFPPGQVCNNALLNQAFVHGKVATWTSTIIENVLKELAVANTEAAKKEAQKFKYVGARCRKRTRARATPRCCPAPGCSHSYTGASPPPPASHPSPDAHAIPSRPLLHRSHVPDAAENGVGDDHGVRPVLGQGDGWLRLDQVGERGGAGAGDRVRHCHLSLARGGRTRMRSVRRL